MISTNSFVIDACRPRLYFICNEPIISVAFLDALSIAFRLGHDSELQRKAMLPEGVPCTNLRSVPLDETSKDGVGKCELSKIASVVFLLVVFTEAVYRSMSLYQTPEWSITHLISPRRVGVESPA